MNKLKRDWSKCHLCGSEMQKDYLSFSSVCPNGCMKFVPHHINKNIVLASFFDSDLAYYLIDDKSKKMDYDKDILDFLENDRVRYLKTLTKWKENDRYLMKLIGGE